MTERFRKRSYEEVRKQDTKVAKGRNERER
jgi:hypothetical protein